MIQLRELFDKALISVPKSDVILSLDELQDGHRFEYRGGVYFFYNSLYEPLYVGISSNLGKRVPEHIQSLKGNRDLVHYVASGKYLYVEGFYEDNKMFQEVYESYLIYIMKPRFNVQKTGRKRI